MNKKNIHFHMKNDTSTTSFDANGSFEDDKLSFIDNEDQKNYILFKDNKVEYVKMGDRFMHYTFDEENRSKGIYRVDGFDFDFQIETIELTYSLNHLQVHFVLHQEDEIIGNHHLAITFTDNKED